MPPRKASLSSSAAAKEELSAVLLADSFAQSFRPITVERPKVLLPLVNVPLIDYALEWLAASAVSEVYVVCCAHAELVEAHIKASKWMHQRTCKMHLVVATACLSLGDALRELDVKGVISGDFVLVTGDVVTNMDLGAAMARHRARKAADADAIMTLVMREVGTVGQRRRLGCWPRILAMDPITNRLLRYHVRHDRQVSTTGANVSPAQVQARRLAMDRHFFGERNSVQVRSDLVDCGIAICSAEVLLLFSDNFDYQNLERDFVAGVLSEEELGKKMFVHALRNEYAARVHNLRAYDAISRDVVQRWAFPYVPDANLLPPAGTPGSSNFRIHRHNIYMESDVRVHASAHIGHDTVLGAGCSVSQDAHVVGSVVGRGCSIGRGARVEGSYLHAGVSVGEEARVWGALLCEGAAVRARATLRPGALLSHGVVVGAGHEVPAHTRISLCRQQVPDGGSASDDDLEYAPKGDGASPRPAAAPLPDVPEGADAAASPTGEAETAVGRGGAGFVWQTHGARGEDAVFSTLVLPPLTRNEEDDWETLSDASNTTVAGEPSQATEQEPPEVVFKREVTETFLRCVEGGYDPDLAVIELNSLKIAEDRSFADCARYVFATILSLCLPPPPVTRAEYGRLYAASAPDTATPAGKGQLLERLRGQLGQWGPLLQRFLKGEDEQVDLILTLEEFCDQDGIFASSGEQGATFAPLFPQILKLLYDLDIVSEQPFLDWADEKEHAEEHERGYLNRATAFLTWLREAEEASSADESGEDEDGEMDDSE